MNTESVKKRPDRIYLSPPCVGMEEQSGLAEATDSGWIAPVGPQLDKFESQLSNRLESKSILALNSGTSALHLALVLAGVTDGDHIAIGTHTFAACANVVLYQRARPVFIDSEQLTWNMDPDCFENYLQTASIIPKAVIVTHIYGIPARIEEICRIAKAYKVKIIEDAAEALGAYIGSRPAGTFGDYGIISFNGNKIVTTSSGGALVCTKEDREKGLYLATQSNSGNFGYDHKEIGFNYRMSNILAGLGIAQLAKLEEFVEKKKSITSLYQQSLSEYFSFVGSFENQNPNYWLTAVLVRDPKIQVESLIQFLDQQNIECRRFWKPLHLHEAYSHFDQHMNGTSESLYERGICLPSGSGMTLEEQEYVIKKIELFFAENQ